MPVHDTPPSFRAAAPNGFPAPYAKPGQLEHNAPESRHPSPLRGGGMKELRESLDAKASLQEDDDADDTLQNTLNIVNDAEGLVCSKKRADAEYTAQIAKLPLLQPGQTVRYDDIGMGFRIHDGYKVHYFSDTLIVGTRRADGANAAKTRAYVHQWPFGYAWMYWSSKRFGHEALTLEQCAVKFGVRVHSNRLDDGKPGRWIRKEVLLADPNSAASGGRTPNDQRGFIIAILADGKQIMSQQKEDDAGVYRVWRSDVPRAIQTTIKLRETHDTLQKSQCPRWWEM